jgi:hypothetical protein
MRWTRTLLLVFREEADADLLLWAPSCGLSGFYFLSVLFQGSWQFLVVCGHIGIWLLSIIITFGGTGF